MDIHSKNKIHLIEIYLNRFWDSKIVFQLINKMIKEIKKLKKS